MQVRILPPTQINQVHIMCTLKQLNMEQTLTAKYQLTPLKGFKTLDEQNEWFNSLSRQDQRELIWEDVIASMESKFYDVSPGKYLSIEVDPKHQEGYILSDEIYIATQSHFLSGRIKVCTVCAKGALLVSRVRLGNDYTGDTCGWGYESPLPDIIDEDEWNVCELIFEADHKSLSTEDWSDDLRSWIFDWYDMDNHGSYTPNAETLLDRMDRLTPEQRMYTLYRTFKKHGEIRLDNILTIKKFPKWIN